MLHETDVDAILFLEKYTNHRLMFVRIQNVIRSSIAIYNIIHGVLMRIE